MSITRRAWLGTAAGTPIALTLSGCATTAQHTARVVVVGGGFAGATAARTLKQLNPALHVTLVEPKAVYLACPLSNLVITTDRPLSAQGFGYAALESAGVNVIAETARDVDVVARRVVLEDGTVIGYDKLIMAPGIALRWDALPGYSEATALQMPHAWQAGAQTELLKRQLKALPDGGLVAMAVPDNPYRCPPGPYERASLIAHYLKAHKPRAKLLVLDAKDNFSKQALFQAAWQRDYAGILEWQGRSDGAAVTRVDGAAMTLHTDFDAIAADVANVIPPQQAAAIARRAGLTDASGWCPVYPATFASRRADDVHVIGDAAIANAMPKSAFAANAQAKFCAVQITRLLAGDAPTETTLINTCYSFISPTESISVAGVYKPDARGWVEVPGAGGVSRADAGIALRESEARYAMDWFHTITQSVFAT